MNPTSFAPTHFLWAFADGVATVTLNRPERKNPLTFESYAELRETFRALAYASSVKAIILPRLIGHGRASELLFFGRSMSAEEGERWGFFNKIVTAAELDNEAQSWAAKLAAGPAFANAMTKNQLNQEWSMSLDMAIEAEAQAQAICMQTADFERAYNAFVAKQQPVFQGN